MAAAIFALHPGEAAQQQQRPEAGFLRDCAAAGRRLWGRSLCVPIVVVDPVRGAFRTSEATPGELPALRANTAFEWGGRQWIMVLEPLPRDPAALRALLFHEAWHAHQRALGLAPNAEVAPHLDEWQARYLIRLEWAALGAALRATNSAERRRHAAQALAFRARRHAAFPQAEEAERAQMRHEGLAAYTGAALSGDPLRLALAELEGGPGRPGLARSFSYVSGPAWGLLLDRVRPGWRALLAGGSDLPALSDIAPAAIARADDYGGTSVLGEELLRSVRTQAALAAAVAATAEQRALRLPLARMNMNFDPNQVASAADGSPIYYRITLSDEWGTIEIERIGLRMAPDFTVAYAPWPLGEGNRITLRPGWRIEERPGGGAALAGPGR